MSKATWKEIGKKKRNFLKAIIEFLDSGDFEISNVFLKLILWLFSFLNWLENAIVCFVFVFDSSSFLFLFIFIRMKLKFDIVVFYETFSPLILYPAIEIQKWGQTLMSVSGGIFPFSEILSLPSQCTYIPKVLKRLPYIL